MKTEKMAQAEAEAEAFRVYDEKKAAAGQQMVRGATGEIGLRQRTSNLFRPPGSRSRGRLDLGRFDQVLRIDETHAEVEAEGRISYQALVEATLRRGFLPAVVPQLKSITVGGAISGGGIESSSFRYGFVHETVREMDILLSSGEVVTCRPDNHHRDLFFGIPNSYGTLGYVLRARLALVRVEPYVKLTHRRFGSTAECLAALARSCAEGGSQPDEIDFIDGVVFAEEESYLTEGRLVKEAPPVSNYRGMKVYYRSIREREIDYLMTADYIWRWDTDWFWCSRALGMEMRPLRFLFCALGLLRSTTYWKMRDWARRSGLMSLLGRNVGREDVIQDVEIPMEGAAEFLDFLRSQIGLHPIWLCPTRPPAPVADFVLYQMAPGTLYVNFGFWGSVPSNHPPGYYNRLVERKVQALAGKKSLYSSSYFSVEEFGRIYNGSAYAQLKRSYDPAARLGDLYRKCVGRVE